MKTVINYLEECLSTEDYAKAMSNITAQYLSDDPIETLTATDEADALLSAFTWGHSNEGFDYWQTIYDDLKDRYASLEK